MLCEEGYDGGCCLVCPEAYTGCLCYECKCRQCYHYTYDGNDSGHCDIAKEVWRERLQERQKIENKKWIKETKKLKETNKRIEKEIKERNEIPSWYTCQKCKRDFVTDKELKIIPHKTPVCGICSGELL
jgi:hypothetical protein